MKKKRIHKILIVLGVLLAVYQLLSWFHIFRLYQNSSFANEPNLPLNSRFFASNVIVPEITDFVCYKFEDEEFGKQIRIHRLIGQEGDVVQIKDGNACVNNKNIDMLLNLWHYYRLTKQEFDTITFSDAAIEQGREKDGFIYIPMTKVEARKYGLEEKKVIIKSTQVEPYIYEVFHKNWNKDHFGPITVPRGKVFVLGDNRDNSHDSRYVGFINASDITGVLITN